MIPATEELARKIANKLHKTVKMKAEVRWIASSDGYKEIKKFDVEDCKVQSNTGTF